MDSKLKQAAMVLVFVGIAGALVGPLLVTVGIARALEARRRAAEVTRG